MSFNSIPFLIFLGLFFILWPILKKKTQIRYLYLIVASFIFYGWWDWRFLFLILFSGLLDFYAALFIRRYSNYAKPLLILSLLGNILSLSIFKYSQFFAGQLENFASLLGFHVDLISNLPEFTLILPVGISFYTFQSMSYTIDVYRHRLAPTGNPLHFFAYLAMFPQLVAGPIVRASDFLSQLKLSRKVTGIEFWNGIKLLLIGFFQKTVLADNLAILVNEGFSGIANGKGIYWWVVSLCFAFQIFFDFNGYSQIARGIAKLMGFHFKMNFNNPYSAVSLKDFWSRWHISLSTWFRDYVYFPLGGSRRGKMRSHLNMWITMGLSGLWHGASLNFVVWGLYHALILSIERILKVNVLAKGATVFKFARWLITFVMVLIGWLIFRSESIAQALSIFKEMWIQEYSLDFMKQYLDVAYVLIFSILYMVYVVFFQKRLEKRKQMVYIDGLVYGAILAAIIFFRGPEQEFIYFQF